MKDSHHNGLKTAVLLGGMWALLLALGWGLSIGTNQSMWLWIFAVGGLVSTFISYWFSDKMALASMQAREVTQAEAPELYQMVEELSSKANKPMPRVYISPTMTPNAFATGRNPENAAVCATEGILQLLDYRELRAVMGHELMHVYNRDILISSVAAAIAGLITSIAQFFLFFGGSRDSRGGGNAIVGLLMVFLAPLASAVIQMAISRTREFDADHDGALLSEDPMALASALSKISGGIDQQPLAPTPRREPVGSMMIAHPFRGGGLSRLFSTHPPMAERIRRLETLAAYER